VGPALDGLDVEYRVIRPDGTTVHINDVGRMARDDAGNPLRLVGYTTDVTELKRLEEQLQHAQKMENLGRLAGGVAHEVNNLLTVVLGHAGRSSAPARIGIDGGPIAISVATQAYDEAAAARHPGLQPGEHVVLTVADSGIGIPEDDRSRVFEPFFTTKRDGAGMGLTTCYGIMARASGHIRLESAPGRGTSFACAFPLGIAVAAVAREAAAAAGETVLVAEDEPLVRTLVAGALREQGYTVLEAGDGVEALAIADATPGLALLVTDVVMPSMDGRELAARLRDRVPGIPALFVAGYTDGALEDGEPATAFLPKPFMSAELMAAVRTLLDPEPSTA
jgi:CheY-like chemotaxis protein